MRVSSPTDNRYKVGVRYNELPPWARYSNMVTPYEPGLYIVYEIHSDGSYPAVLYSVWAYWDGARFASRSVSKKDAWERRKGRSSYYADAAAFDPESLSRWPDTEVPTSTTEERRLLLLCALTP